MAAIETKQAMTMQRRGTDETRPRLQGGQGWHSLRQLANGPRGRARSRSRLQLDDRCFRHTPPHVKKPGRQALGEGLKATGQLHAPGRKQRVIRKRGRRYLMGFGVASLMARREGSTGDAIGRAVASLSLFVGGAGALCVAVSRAKVIGVS